MNLIIVALASLLFGYLIIFRNRLKKVPDPYIGTYKVPTSGYYNVTASVQANPGTSIALVAPKVTITEDQFLDAMAEDYKVHKSNKKPKKRKKSKKSKKKSTKKSKKSKRT